MKCPLRKEDSCQLVSDLARVPLPIAKITDSACENCLSYGKDQTLNKVTVSVAISTLHRNRLFDKQEHAYLLKAIGSRIGTGRILSASLWWIAKPEEGACYCRSRAAIMDYWGVDKCEREIETIVGWLMEGAEMHGVKWVPKPLQAELARRMVRAAIKKARKYEKTL